ncbi:MAG: 50S ribosomal protein L18 [Candidatus Jacksonbacteria bacterium]|nr:50S ribosomal protein L18 [Candidatus Jacksonbacteria bacterium]
MKRKTGTHQARKERHARIRSQVKGTATAPRLNVFRSARFITAQLINDDTGEVLAMGTSKDTKTPANAAGALETGKAIAKKAAEKKVEAVVFDRGGYAYHGRVKALADGAREAGLKF